MVALANRAGAGQVEMGELAVALLEVELDSAHRPAGAAADRFLADVLSCENHARCSHQAAPALARREAAIPSVRCRYPALFTTPCATPQLRRFRLSLCFSSGFQRVCGEFQNHTETGS